MFLYSQIHGRDAKMRIYNWKKHNKIKENEFEILLQEGLRIVNETEEPWNVKQYGRRPYPSKAMVNICLLKVYFQMPYRDIESLIRSNRTFQEILELKTVPDHNTIQRAMEKIPIGYLKDINQKLTFSFKKREQTLPSMQLVLA
jgi:hypothetical protein